RSRGNAETSGSRKGAKTRRGSVCGEADMTPKRDLHANVGTEKGASGAEPPLCAFAPLREPNPYLLRDSTPLRESQFKKACPA
ncbi:MAG: hypothetical protein AB7E24_10270, partial [Novosphingobium sp.]